MRDVFGDECRVVCPQYKEQPIALGFQPFLKGSFKQGCATKRQLLFRPAHSGGSACCQKNQCRGTYQFHESFLSKISGSRFLREWIGPGLSFRKNPVFRLNTVFISATMDSAIPSGESAPMSSPTGPNNLFKPSSGILILSFFMARIILSVFFLGPNTPI